MSAPPAIVYRGQLHAERSRIDFLVGAVSEAFEEFDLVYLAPSGATPQPDVESHARSYPNLRRFEYLAAPRSGLGSVRRRLATGALSDTATVIAIGFRTSVAVPSGRRVAWCVNGIPEERLVHRDTPARRIAVRAAWLAARRHRPALAVTVSEPMGSLVRRRTGSETLVVPNTVDRSVFRSDSAAAPVYLTYQGGGSPWQGLDVLSTIWAELHDIRPSLRFRIVSRDPRTDVLSAGLPADVVERRSADEPAEVAALLAEARLGFLIREPNIVNRVSWPMKLGEYLGAGAPVVASRCGWGVEALLADHDAGLVIDRDEHPRTAALRIVDYLDSLGDGRPEGVTSAADALDGNTWRSRLADALAAVHERVPTGSP